VLCLQTTGIASENRFCHRWHATTFLCSLVCVRYRVWHASDTVPRSRSDPAPLTSWAFDVRFYRMRVLLALLSCVHDAPHMVHDAWHMSHAA
jgi:hypothetical protein